MLALLATCASASPYKSGEEEEEEEEEEKGHSGHLLPSSSTKWILGRSHLHHVVVVLQGLKFSVRYRPGVLVVNPVKCKPNYKKDRRVFARVVLCL